ncbi:MAG TPA: alpha-2-macroglobulin family protein, partial [Myxococcota bacterium]
TADIVAKKTGHIGADGTLALDLGEAEALAGRPSSLSIEADVADVSNNHVANRASVTLHPARVYAGVKVGTQEGAFLEMGQPMHLSLVAVDVDGKAAPAIGIAVAVQRREWKSIRKKNPMTNAFESMSEPVDVDVGKCTVSSDAKGAAACDVNPDKPGRYIIKATSTDEKGRHAVTSASAYVLGGGFTSWQQGDSQIVELVADKKIYQPGETARVLVKSPWPDAEALVTVEREGVLLSKRQKVGPTTAVSIPIDDNSIPNVYATVLIVRGRVAASGGASKEIDPGRPQVRAGYVMLPVEKKSKRLHVNVDAGAGPQRPGTEVHIKLAVTDSTGKGAPAEVAVWAVDEAVLRLTDYALPDPVQSFHPQRGLSVRLGEPLVLLVKQQELGEKGRPPGGGGGGGPSGFRSNFKTTAFFVPDVVTDAQGNADVKVKLPDDLTTYRVMALAVNDGDRAGSGRTDLVVTKPLLAIPALPRLARVGDAFSAGVVLHAQKAGDVVVKADLQGLTLDGPAEKTVHIDVNEAVEVRFAMKAEHPGRAKLRFSASGGGESDGVEQLLPVTLPMVIETVGASGSTNDKREEGLAPPADVWPDVGGLDVTLASTAMAGFQGAMEQLVQYPYGCAEQLSSRLVPFLALRELGGAFGVKRQAPKEDEAQ